MMQRKVSNYIDKTKSLEEGISRFPSIYIEGNAASGKTTAVKMLLDKHPEVIACILELDLESKEPEKLLEKLFVIRKRMEKETLWAVIENMSGNLGSELAAILSEMVRGIRNDSRMIFVSREKPQIEFLDLLWKGRMELIPMEKLLLSLEEVRTFAQCRGSALSAEKVYEKTGGWSGCVDLLLRLSKNKEGCQGKPQNEEELLNSYEVRSYVQNEILSALTAEEHMFLAHVTGCPWVNEELCRDVWGMNDAAELLEDLHRKGFLVFEAEKKRWKTAPLFQRYILPKMPMPGKENVWYENAGCIAEAFWCLKKSGTEEAYRDCMLRYYDQVYALGLLSEDVLKWKEKQPKYIYLRGAYDYSVQDFEGLKKEILNLKKLKEKDLQTKEILLNLQYMDPEMSLTDWLDLLAEYTQGGMKFKLYHILGNSVTYLCGIRDLSGMFACAKKEENRRGRLWKDAFGETEWKCYQLARIDYYLETERKDTVSEEDWDLLREKSSEAELWQIRMAKLYLLCKLQRMQPEETRVHRIYELENSLRKENHPTCADIAEAISSLYAPWYGAREKMSKWLRYMVLDNTMAFHENNYVLFYCRAMGYVLLNQYERAEKILKKLAPYMQAYHRYRFAAEVLFQYAIVNWGKNLRGQAVKNTIESFLISGNSRYVSFYGGYGQKGQQVLEAYVEWLRSSTPEGWSRKKKYNYGNVLRMPVEDYLEVIMRCTKKASKSGGKFLEEYIEERLTMMETIILQDIGRGMSNAEICQELGIKLPTVKGHIYSLFKKLGVNSRVQAVMKGKELGVLE